MVDYGKKLIHGTIIIFVFSVISMLIGYTQKVIFANTIGVAQIGLFFSVLGFIAFFTFFRDLGLSDALIYFLPRFIIEDSKPKIKFSILFTLFVQVVLGLFFFLVMYFLSDFLALSYFKDPAARNLLVFLALYFIVDGVHEVLLKVFMGYQKTFLQQALDFSFQAVSFIFILAVIFLKKDLYYFGIAYLVADIIVIIIFYAVFIKKVFPDFYRVKTEKGKEIPKDLMKYSLSILASTISDIGFTQQTIFFLTFFTGLEAVAYYVMARAIAKLAIFMYKASARVFAPMISELWKRKEKKELAFLFKEQLVINYTFAFPIIFGIFLFPDIVLRILYGEQFVAASNVLRFGSLYMLFDILNSTLTSVSLNTGYVKISKYNSLIRFAANLGLNIFLIPKFGLLGAVISDLLSNIAATVYILFSNIKNIGLSLPYSEFTKIIFSSLTYIAVLSILREFLKKMTLNVYFEMGIISFISGIVYLATVFYFKLINLNKISNLVKKATNNRLDLSRFEFIR